jgi:hypothetical protein
MFVPTAIAPTAAAVSSLQLDAMASSPAAIGALGDVAVSVAAGTVPSV